MNRDRLHKLTLLGALLLIVSGCAGMYFREAAAPPPPPIKHLLAQWPYTEYWTGIVFNGAKIGYSHFSLTPSEKEKVLGVHI